jgi:hypothetical protein
MKEEMYATTYGIWQVTTEGDVEGRTTRQLGSYEGHVDEIALHLAEKAFYGLTFKLQQKINKYIPTRTSVHVKFDIDSNTWNMDGNTIIRVMKELFADRPVNIEKSNYYASFKISTEKNQRAEDRRRALEKLTDYDKELLGLE